MKTTIFGTPTWRANKICSRVWGIGPSAAFTTKIDYIGDRLVVNHMEINDTTAKQIAEELRGLDSKVSQDGSESLIDFDVETAALMAAENFQAKTMAYAGKQPEIVKYEN